MQPCAGVSSVSRKQQLLKRHRRNKRLGLLAGLVALVNQRAHARRGLVAGTHLDLRQRLAERQSVQARLASMRDTLTA